ncbi:carboxypeptidase-like protein [Mucilaginibacter yixingensis]|uniref:Carboxypeptidase-like protein n=1 Tax=Mucilaginibacter yixingensis TaxID=1295612 RepID=A0A2T5J9Z3_9SPHI|nr:carboxypeptidase-like regulatory domain-containing protein [Mucilaginibacter yixingensis]PTQ96886.1 carboxypeptidase-like protein [Mucilaginibacter yixingensis]
MQAIKHISIPQPCHEQWDNMKKEEQGRFCQSCAKTVIDFSVMTDQQVINYLSGTHNVCGKFDAMQFNTVNNKLYAQNLQQASWWKKLAIAGALTSMLPLFKAQAQDKPAQEQSDTIATPKTIMLGKVAGPVHSSKNRMLTGCVSDNRQPLIGVTVKLPGTNTAVATDVNGRFQITVPQDAKTLEFDYIGYNQLVTPITTNNYYDVKMDERRAMLGGVVVVRAPFYKRWYYRFVKRPVKKIFG